MLRGAVVIVALVAAAWAPLAHACDAQATASVGAAPLAVTYTATCTSSAYHWVFGDGATADGPTATHTFGAGSFAPTLTTDGGTDALPAVRATAVTLRAPHTADWHSGAVFTGTVSPAPAHVRLYRGSTFVAAADAAADGRFRIVARVAEPGNFTARAAGAVSVPAAVTVQPLLRAQVSGALTLGGRAVVTATLLPRGAGVLRLDAPGLHRRGAALKLPLATTHPGPLRIRIQSVPRPGFAAAARTLDVSIAFPAVAESATGLAVHALESRLAQLHYALGGVDSTFGADTVDAVIAFQKVQGLPRTGTVDAAVWRALAHPRAPVPRYGTADHVEVDKAHQVLYLVHGGGVALIVPVSTAGVPGDFTPVGRYAVYRKVTGFDPSPLGVLYDPSYFTGGYAIHGNPSVPPYPASHGCVRVPMWVAPRLYDALPVGEPVDVY